MSLTNVAVIGTGTMGSVMVGHLARRGHTVAVWNRTRERASSALAAGGHWASTPADASRDAHVVLVVLSGDETVLDVLGRTDGVLAGCRAGTVVIEMSTTAASTKREAAAAAARAGVDFLDAPFFGSLREAEAGGLCRWSAAMRTFSPGPARFWKRSVIESSTWVQSARQPR